MCLSDPRSGASLAQAIAACRPELLRSAHRQLGHHEAEDVIQATLERALIHRATFVPNSNLLAWLRRIMSNLIIDVWRRRMGHLVCAIEPDKLMAPAPDEPSPWQALTAADLRDAIARLPLAFRTVFALHVAGHSYKEISRRTGLPGGTVGSKLKRARVRLRKLLAVTIEQRTIRAQTPIALDSVRKDRARSVATADVRIAGAG